MLPFDGYVFVTRYLGRDTQQSTRRSHQGALLMLKALSYIQQLPFWRKSDGRDHVWMNRIP